MGLPAVIILVPSGNDCYIAMENAPFLVVFPLNMVDFSRSLFNVYQRAMVSSKFIVVSKLYTLVIVVSSPRGYHHFEKQL